MDMRPRTACNNRYLGDVSTHIKNSGGIVNVPLPGTEIGFPLIYAAFLVDQSFECNVDQERAICFKYRRS